MTPWGDRSGKIFRHCFCCQYTGPTTCENDTNFFILPCSPWISRHDFQLLGPTCFVQKCHTNHKINDDPALFVMVFTAFRLLQRAIQNTIQVHTHRLDDHVHWNLWERTRFGPRNLPFRPPPPPRGHLFMLASTRQHLQNSFQANNNPDEMHGETRRH